MSQENEESPYRLNLTPYGTHALLVAEVPANSRVLEIGSATGYMGEYLIKEKECKVWGVEPVVKWRDIAAKRGYEEVSSLSDEAYLKTLPAGTAFDCILLADVLEHMPDPEKTLTALRQYCAPDGRLIISLPNIAHYSTRWGLLMGKWDMTDWGILDRTHLHFYTKKTAGEMIRQAGYEIEKCRPAAGYIETWGEWFFSIGKRLLFTWPEFFAPQFIFVAKPR